MKILFSIGDLNGIGLEILLKAFNKNIPFMQTHHFSIVCNVAILKHFCDNFFQHICKIERNYIVFHNNLSTKIDIIDIKHPDVLKIAKELKNNLIELKFGELCKNAGTIAYHSIKEASLLAIDKQFDAIVTLPVSKKAIHLYQNQFIGHTELITSLCRKKHSIMMLLCDKLRVVLATLHTPIYKICKQITSKKLRSLIKNFQTTLKKDFAIPNPHIAMLGLNPHAGDGGMFGKHEQTILLPAIEVMKKKGVDIEGPFAADGFFARRSYERFDGVIAMYHDQGLIPLKMLAENGGVNFTANLPIVRTSPDHGTAFDIAGKDSAGSDSVIEAIRCAIDVASKRQKRVV